MCSQHWRGLAERWERMVVRTQAWPQTTPPAPQPCSKSFSPWPRASHLSSRITCFVICKKQLIMMALTAYV